MLTLRFPESVVSLRVCTEVRMPGEGKAVWQGFTSVAGLQPTLELAAPAALPLSVFYVGFPPEILFEDNVLIQNIACKAFR